MEDIYNALHDINNTLDKLIDALKPKFIKVTFIDVGVGYIPINNLVVYYNNLKEQNMIQYTTQDDPSSVKETPEEIMTLIKEA